MIVYKERGMIRNLISQDKIYTIIVVDTKLFNMLMENKNPFAHMCNLKLKKC